jgi:hypothetical protein
MTSRNGDGKEKRPAGGVAAIRERVKTLQERRVALNEQLMQCSDRRQANAIERELYAIRTAVRHYEAALKIESGWTR